MMNTIKTKKLSKTYDYKSYIFKDIDLELSPDNIYAIAGKNGSGKSTLLQILAGLLSPTEGKVIFNESESDSNIDISFVAPYYNLYEEFTPEEHCKLIAGLKGQEYDKERFNYYIKKFELDGKQGLPIKSFSSGMKQRVKLIIAFLFNPDIVYLDEPSTNLDSSGVELLREEVKKLNKSGKLIIIASNEEHEIQWCDKIITLK